MRQCASTSASPGAARPTSTRPVPPIQNAALQKSGLLCPLCQRRGARHRSACAALQLIDAQDRRQDEWTTVDPALIRGLATA